MEEEFDEQEANDISKGDTLSKYRQAGDIASKALAAVTAAVAPGKKISELCLLGDTTITTLTSKIFTKLKKEEKGVAFPTCVCVNNIVGHYSPSDASSKTIQEGDLVTIDLGVQLDGYVAVLANTVLAGKQEKLTGRKADVVACAHQISEAVVRGIKPGYTNTHVTEAIKKISADYKCTPVEGVLMHQMKKFIIDGNKVIIAHPKHEEKVEQFTFEAGEIYGIDIVVSTGDGRAREEDTKTTIFKRSLDAQYNLKLKTSRSVFTELTRAYPTFPFHIRNLGEEAKTRMALVECLKHELVHPYPVLFEKSGEYVAHIKYTLIVFASRTERLPAAMPAVPAYDTQYTVTDPQIKAVLATEIATKKKGAAKEGMEVEKGGEKKEAGEKKEEKKEKQEEKAKDSMDTST